MSKVNVLYIILNMNDGGAQKIILNYLNDFKDDSTINANLLVLDSKNNHENGKVLDDYKSNVTYLDCFSNKRKSRIINRLVVFFTCYKKVKSYLQNNHIDIVHVHLLGSLLLCLNPLLKSSVNIRFYTLHSNPYRFKGYKKYVMRKAFNKGNFIGVCVTNEQVKQATEHYEMKRYEVVHNGINFDKISNEMISKRDARVMFGLKKEDFVICAVGRLDPIKKFDYLIDVFSIIYDYNQNSRLLIAGDGNQKEELINQINQLGLNEKIILLGNITNTTQLYCASDVLAITSQTESASLVLLEAQRCDLKCVISNGTPSESIITNKVIKMKKDASIEEWSEAILNGNNFTKPEYSFNDYEVHAMSNKMKNIYLKYFNE